jgi:uncharacterized membrane protein YfcA
MAMQSALLLYAAALGGGGAGTITGTGGILIGPPSISAGQAGIGLLQTCITAASHTGPTSLGNGTSWCARCLLVFKG